MINLGKIILENDKNERLSLFMYNFKNKYFRDDLFLENEADYKECINGKNTLFDSHIDSINDLNIACAKYGYKIIEREC